MATSPLERLVFEALLRDEARKQGLSGKVRFYGHSDVVRMSTLKHYAPASMMHQLPRIDSHQFKRVFESYSVALDVDP